MNASEDYSRRRFVRHSLTLAGVTFAWGQVRTNAWAEPAAAGPAGADEALAELVAGNKRYVTGQNTHHDFGPERSALAQSQHPFAIILGCADSRVSPELAFDQTRGRLFVVSVAGNFIDENRLASIEFGASVLGASLIMVLGHDQCGAIKGAIDVYTKNAQLPGHLPGLVAHLKAPVEKALNEQGRCSKMRSARIFCLTLKHYVTPNRSLLTWLKKIVYASSGAFTNWPPAGWKF